MCLIVVGWRVHPDYPLVVAANRDARPTAPLGRWPDAPEVIGGLDLEAGGTWLGITATGRFAAVTNVREPGMTKGAQSRGFLTRGFLTGESSAEEYAAQIDGAQYLGFNLLLSDGESLVYCSNRDGNPRPNWSPPAKISPKPCPACPMNPLFLTCSLTKPSSPMKICRVPVFPSNGNACCQPSSSNRKATAHGRQRWSGKPQTATSRFTKTALSRTGSRFSLR